MRTALQRRWALLSGRLLSGVPGTRTEVIITLLRAAVAITAGAALALTAHQDAAAHHDLTMPAVVQMLYGLVALVAAVPLAHLTTEVAVQRVARASTAVDVGFFAAYSAAFHSRPGAGTAFGVFVLLLGPARWGWLGALVTGLPVGLISTLWPQVGVNGTTYTAVQVWLLVALFVIPGAAISSLSRRAGARFHQAQEQFRTAFEHASIGMALLDEDLRVLQANRSLGQLVGISESALIGTSFDELLAEDDRQQLRRAAAELATARHAVRLEVGVQRPDGAPRWALLAASWLAGSAGVPPRIVAQVENISERKQAEERMSHLASHDGLTGLPNRSLLRNRLDDALQRGERIGLLFLDLDRFKIVNDGLGHAAGDELLCAVADRLAQVLRPGDLVARIGGDEFVMLCHDVGGENDLARIAVRVLASVRPPVRLSTGSDVVVGASVGAAVAAPDATADSLLRAADSAMYAAKSAGGSRVQMFTSALLTQALQTHELETDLRRAVAEGQLRLVYQPVVDLATGRVSSLEALLRWYHPLRGAVRPSEFIPLAEQSELIIEIGTWVLRRAVEDAASWPSVGGLTAIVAVNVSPRQLSDPGFASLVGQLLEESGLPGTRLCLELTETALIGDVRAVVASLRALRELGVRLAIDDFGTGHASLSYLTQFPVDSVKVDQSFVAGVATDAGSAAIVGGVVAMAHAFGLRAVAEGAETADQLAALRRLGCESAQGFVLASPMAADAVAGVLGAAATVQPVVPAPRDGRAPDRDGLDEARRYRLLLDCARDVSACLDLESVLERSFLSLRKVVAFTGGSIQLVDGDVIRLAATDPPAPPEALRASIPIGKGIGGNIALTGEPRYLPDITIVSAVTNAPAVQQATSGGVRSYYGVPLIAEGRVIGVLQVDSTEVDAFDEQDRLLILSFAAIVASAVETARLFALEIEALELQGD